MNFASITFVFYFLPTVIILYYLCPGRRCKNIFLLLTSLFFYAWGESVFLLILIGSIVFNHQIVSFISIKKAKVWLVFGVIGNLSLLVFLKYFNWFANSLGVSGQIVNIHLPLGISFFTFQAISMLVDVFRGQKKAKSLFDTALYIAMFPQLVAGPIVRFNEIRNDIYERSETLSKFAAGAFIFVIGLAQKVLLADNLAIPANAAFATDPATLTPLTAWFGLFCFSLQIFYDFAGYSNMAIGLGRFFGFELPQNFNFPYSSASFKEFWRRWHITLSRWFKDYLYIPLGGSHNGRAKTYRNLIIVFMLCGVWHGAAWTFVLWGLWHGLFLILERIVGIERFKLPKPIGMMYVWLFVSLGWVLFRAESLEHAYAYILALNPLQNNLAHAAIDITNTAIVAFIFGLICMWDGWKSLYNSLIVSRLNDTSFSLQLSRTILWSFVGVLYILCFLSLAAQTHSAFIYFRF